LTKECCICNKEDWEDLDYIRNHEQWYKMDMRNDDEPVGFKVCRNCGYVTYNYIDKDRLSEIYNRQRQIMSSANIPTCNRKNLYHKTFLDDCEDKGFLNLKSNLKCLDVGMAQGAFLNLLHEEYGIKKSNLYGTEWSESFKNFGKYEYGINASKEIDRTIQYDFISYYHVLEHIQNPVQELMDIRSNLKDDGFLYLSVPVWFESLEEFSGPILSSFENLYHVNHCCVFSKNSLLNVLRKTGFEIIHDNSDLYAYTILLKKVDPKDEVIKENYQEIKTDLENQKEAIELCNLAKYDEAMKVYPNFPDVYILNCMHRDVTKEFDLQVKILNQGLEETNNSVKIMYQLGVLYYQWDMVTRSTPENQYYSNNIKKSEKILKDSLTRKPTEDTLYILAMIEGQYKHNYEESVRMFKQILEINPSRFKEIWDRISYMWKEKK